MCINGFSGSNGLRESASTPRSTPSGHSTVRNIANAISPLSRYLVIPSASSNANTNRKVPKARLLTSDQCLAELEEKERNKKLAAEEKERKKKEREEKRRQKQELLEEKRRQKEENARKKAEEKLRKAEDKAKKTQEKAEARAKRQQASVRSNANKRALNSESAAVSEESMPSKRTRVASTSNTSSGVSTRLSCLPRITGETDEEEIDPNVCCMCFVTFEEDTREQTGAEWLPCACGSWLHEDCAEDIVVDSDGNELCCPFCVV